MSCNFPVIGSLALPDHITRALFAVPPTGDGLTANGDSRLHVVCGERVVIINSTLSLFVAVAWKSTCERNLKECFRWVQFSSVMSQFASFYNGNLLMHCFTLFAGPWMKILIGS